MSNSAPTTPREGSGNGDRQRENGQPPSLATAVPEAKPRSLNDAIKHVSAASLTFLLTTSFLGITAISITDLHLLVGHRVKLPLLLVDVSALQFSIVAPIMVVLFHLVFLVQVYLLAKEARRAASQVARTEVLLPTIFAQVFNPSGFQIESNVKEPPRTRFWLWLIVRSLLAIVLLIVPLVLLGIIQWKFVPYHHFWITFLHQALMTFDVLVCFALVPLILAKEDRWRAWWRYGWVRGNQPRYLTRGLFLAILLSALGFTWLLAVVPGTLLESRWDHWRVLAGRWLDRDLRLAGIDLVTEPPDDLAAAMAASGGTRAAAPGAAPPTVGGGQPCPLERPTLDLSGRNLRGADLSHARLSGASLRGANLEGASLVGADFRCADFSPLGSGELIHVRTESRLRETLRLDSASTRRTVLRNADLTSATLRGAWLELADLRGANLSAADLRGAQGTRADLRSAVMRATHLEAADFSYSRLDSAVLDDAHAFCATLYAVSAKGLQALDLAAVGADLRRVDLRGAAVGEARLVASDLGGARLEGGDFRGVRLPAAEGLDLRAVDLRWAEVGGAKAAVLSRYPNPDVDARGITTLGISKTERLRAEEEFSDLEVTLEGHWLALRRLRSCMTRLRRLVESPADGTSAGPMVSAASRSAAEEVQEPRPWLLRDADAPAGTAGEADLGEEERHHRLRATLVGQACEDRALASLLVLRSRGCIPPRDPALEDRLREVVDAGRDGAPACSVLAAAVEKADSLAPARELPPRSVNLSGVVDSDWPEAAPRPYCARLGQALRAEVADEP